MNIENEICSSVISVVKELYGQDVHENMVQLQKTRSNFEGNLTTSKWAKITKSSQDTALRDISDLVNKGILVKANSGGRSTYYELKTDFLY